MDKVVLRNAGQTILLDAVGKGGGTGGQGNVHRDKTNPLCVVKLFKDPQPELFEPIEHLIANQLLPTPDYIPVFPRDIALDPATKEPVGFAMDAVKSGIDAKQIFIVSKWLPEEWRIRAALNYAKAMAALEAAGYRQQDKENVQFLPNGSVAIIDCDSLQIAETHRNDFAKVFYLSPQLITPHQDGTFLDHEFTAQHAVWGHAFELWKLVRGVGDFSPFHSRWLGPGRKPDELTRIEDGLFPWTGKHADVEPSKRTADISNMDPALKLWFFQCFDDGHAIPLQRPSIDRCRDSLADRDSGNVVTLHPRVWQAAEAGDDQMPQGPIFASDTNTTATTPKNFQFPHAPFWQSPQQPPFQQPIKRRLSTKQLTIVASLSLLCLSGFGAWVGSDNTRAPATFNSSNVFSPVQLPTRQSSGRYTRPSVMPATAPKPVTPRRPTRLDRIRETQRLIAEYAKLEPAAPGELPALVQHILDRNE